MESAAWELASIRSLLERKHDATPRELRLERLPLRGGLEADGIARVAVRYQDQRGRRQVFAVVVKRLTGETVREALVYRHFVAAHPDGLAPSLLDADQRAPDAAVLVLEALRPVRRWPWRETSAAQTVLARVAPLHLTAPAPEALAVLAAWDYEAQLRHTAEITLQRLERVRRLPDSASLAKGTRSVGRLVAELPRLRRQLLAFAPFGRAPIHGDLHPGNAMMRRWRGHEQPVLLDWGRARIGSPLEDVSSWLHSLGCWEPEARRRHDTLLAGYLSARGLDRRLGSDLRAANWLAGASNALAGALSYHLSVLLDDTVAGARRAAAAHSAREWVRVLRRADALWR